MVTGNCMAVMLMVTHTGDFMPVIPEDLALLHTLGIVWLSCQRTWHGYSHWALYGCHARGPTMVTKTGDCMAVMPEDLVWLLILGIVWLSC